MSKYTTQTVSLSGALDAMADIGHLPARIVSFQKRALITLQRRLPPEAKRDIGAEYNLSPTRISDGLSSRATSDGVSLIGKARGINVIEFGATWSRVKGSGLVATSSKRKFTAVKFGSKLRGDSALGAKYTIKRGGDRGAESGTFIARGKNGALLVFHRAGKKRLPLVGVYGPSVGQMLKHGRRPERLVDFAIRTLQSEQVRLLGSTP